MIFSGVWELKMNKKLDFELSLDKVEPCLTRGLRTYLGCLPSYLSPLSLPTYLLAYLDYLPSYLSPYLYQPTYLPTYATYLHSLDGLFSYLMNPFGHLMGPSAFWQKKFQK
jgi:hypothetical protein